MLTDLAIKALPAAPKGQTYHWDRDGLCVRVSVAGTKTFYLVTGRERKHLKLGRYPHISLSQARQLARTILAEKTLGIYQEPTDETLGAVRSAFLKAYQSNSPRTVRDTTRLLSYLDPLAKRVLSGCPPREVLETIEAASDGESQRRHIFVAAATFLKWAARNHYIKQSPLAGIPVPSKPKSRERVLTDDELRAVYGAALEIGYPYGFIVLLCIHGFFRPNEAAAMKWSYITPQYFTLPAEITKQRREHILPNLLAPNLALIPKTGSEFLFPSAVGTPFTAFSKNKARLDALSGVTGFTNHDLRRTAASKAAEWQCGPPHVIERALGHSTGTMTPLARTYNRHDYLNEVRAMLLRYEQKLAALIST